MKDFPSTTFSGHGLVCLRGERIVFAGLDFSVSAGEALILLGPNGSGKSSLLRVMAGLLRPMSGMLSWNGHSVREDPESHAGRIHYVGHHDAVKPVLTVAENLRFWARLHDPKGAEGHLDAALEAFDLIHLADVPGRMLSAGQKRRLNLARLIAAPAQVWLLDEPSVALDRASVARLEAAIAAHRAQGGMAVVSTHAEIAMPGAKIMNLDDFTPDAETLAAGLFADLDEMGAGQ
nr:heme ABC exporter ATP-binding protein CcmA [Telmatospirillum sp. J64-1]